MDNKSVSSYVSMSLEVSNGFCTLKFIDEKGSVVTYSTEDSIENKNSMYSAINKLLSKGELIRYLLNLIDNFEAVENTITNKDIQANQAEFNELVKSTFVPTASEQLELDLNIEESI